MSHQVFISYSSTDRAVADAVCITLESAGIACWIAPRNILPGSDWTESIVHGVAGAQVLVLVYSARSNVSPEVQSEVRAARSKRIPILPLRIEDARLSPSMEYLVGAYHWLDAVSVRPGTYLPDLVSAVRQQLLGSPDTPGTADAPQSQGSVGVPALANVPTELVPCAPPPLKGLPVESRKSLPINRLRPERAISRRTLLTGIGVLLAAIFAGCAWFGVPRLFLRAGTVSRSPVDGAEMVYVPPGMFRAGAGGRQVRLTRGFWLYRTEVTNEQYARFLTENPTHPKPAYWPEPRLNAPKQPVIGVSWQDAQDYCRWAGCRLPTEAEWEYAARGPERPGALLKYPWGNESPEGRAVFGLDHYAGRPAPVGSLPAGASWCGALDMAGNAREWCADWYDVDYYEKGPSVDPLGPAQGTTRVLRGGSWGSEPYELEVWQRGANPPANRHFTYGLRPARSE
jgi:formylglycine-generating enzyme required for sulfatase activity